MSQSGILSEERASAENFRQVAPTSIIRYRTSRLVLTALVLSLALVLGLGAYILLHRDDKVAAVEEPAVASLNAGDGKVLDSDYGTFYLLKNGELYYAASADVEFNENALPGVYGRYVIEDDDIEDFSAPSEIVGGKPMTTEYVFNGYRVLDEKNISDIRELETENIVGSRNFIVKDDSGKEYMLVVTLGSVQRTLVYDEKTVQVEIEVASASTEEKTVVSEKPVAQESVKADENSDAVLNAAREEADKEYQKALQDAATKAGGKVVSVKEVDDSATAKIAEAKSEAKADTSVRKTVTLTRREPRIETALGQAQMQIIEL